MPKTYRKTMTRDHGFLAQEAWSFAFEEFNGAPNPYAPALVYHVVDGAAEIWEQDRAFKWFKNNLLKINKKDPQFFEQSLKEYKKILKEMKIKRKVLSLSSLKKLSQDFHQASKLFVVLYYSAYNEKTPKKIRDKALAWREHDDLYTLMEDLIKKSLAKNFPQARGLELVVGIKDLKKMPSRKELQRRFKECVYIPGAYLKNVSLQKFPFKDYKFIIEEPKQKVTQLKGQVACPGSACGRVRILRRVDQVKEFKAGEILISPMTTPDFLPAIKRAGALVTDEGGITCHAAIVARELDKPCLIGTKFATEIFKDGDMVEIKEGVIKKV